MNQELILILKEFHRKGEIYLEDRRETCLLIAIENTDGQSLFDCSDVTCANCPCSFLPNHSHYINHIRNLPIPVKEINEWRTCFHTESNQYL